MIMSTNDIILLTTIIWVAMLLKHFVCDFLLQYPRHYLNKGIYGRWGGIEHAAIHGIATAILLNPILGIVDFIIHYHIDWAKMKVNSHMGWKPDNSEHFWSLLGLDQLLHYITYTIMIYIYLTGNFLS
jgi:hypothetical protein